MRKVIINLIHRIFSREAKNNIEVHAILQRNGIKSSATLFIDPAGKLRYDSISEYVKEGKKVLQTGELIGFIEWNLGQRRMFQVKDDEGKVVDYLVDNMVLKISE